MVVSCSAALAKKVLVVVAEWLLQRARLHQVVMMALEPLPVTETRRQARGGRPRARSR